MRWLKSGLRDRRAETPGEGDLRTSFTSDRMQVKIWTLALKLYHLCFISVWMCSCGPMRAHVWASNDAFHAVMGLAHSRLVGDLPW